jgi:phenylpyruvate tautomerase PptA (4-oxalocrotonate tautomerase family)
MRAVAAGPAVAIFTACRIEAKGATMPLVRIDLSQDAPETLGRDIGEVIYQAMIDVINVPRDDKFQIVTWHGWHELAYPASYLGIEYSPGIVFIQITLNQGRTVELKKAFYRRVADDLHRKLDIRLQDIVINLVEVPKENWSFGNGEMQYA